MTPSRAFWSMRASVPSSPVVEPRALSFSPLLGAAPPLADSKAVPASSPSIR